MRKLGKHTLLIDGNYFLHSRLFVLPRPSKGKEFMKTESEKEQLMRKLSLDFASEVRKVGSFVDQIVFAVDDRSWRKDLFPEAEYKGTRSYDDSINWNNVFEVYGEFQEILKNTGVVVNKVSGAEADDVMFGWANQLNNNGKSCIVWTGDRDLIQLVNYNEATDAYTLWYYNSKKNLIAFQGFSDVLAKRKTIDLSNDDLLFNMGSEDSAHDALKEDFQAWVDKNGVNISEINCDDFIFVKILQGDKSDNIKSVVTWNKEGKNGKVRTYSITEKMAESILEQYKETEGNFHIDDFFNKDLVDKIVHLIQKNIGRADINETRIRFNQNMDLMLLHYNTIPRGIQKGIYENVNADIDSTPQFNVISDMNSMLKGTKWFNDKKGRGAPTSYDPFAGLSSLKPKDKETKDLTSLF